MAIRLDQINLNLLVELEALLRERSVGRAAKRRRVTQSAMSHSLRRLREALGNPLLVRAPGGKMTLTPRAERLRARLGAELEALSRALGDEGSFDAATSTRTYRIATTDFFASVMAGPLLERLRRDAPGIRLELQLIEPGRVHDLLDAGEVDAMLTALAPDRPALRRRKLLEHPSVCIVRAGHPLTRRRLDADAYFAAEHVEVAPRGVGSGYVENILRARGRQRRVVMYVPWFSAAPAIVAQTDLVAMVPKIIADRFADLGLAILPPPFDIPPVSLLAVWHERLDGEPDHQFLREAMTDAASTIA